METISYTAEDIAEFAKQLPEISVKTEAVVKDLVEDGFDPSIIAAAFVIYGAAALSLRFEPDVVLTLIRDAMTKHGARLQ